MRLFLLICLLTVAIPNFVLGQKMPEDYYVEGHAALLDSDYEKAILDFRYLIDWYGEKVEMSILHTLGVAYMRGKYYDSASVKFRNLFDDTAHQNTMTRRVVAHDMFENYLAWHMYDSAIKYLYWSDTGGKTDFYICGWTAQIERRKFRDNLVRYYEQKGDSLMAAKELLKTALDLSNWTDSTELHHIKAILLKYFTGKHLKSELKNAIQHLKIDYSDEGKIVAEQMLFLNTKMEPDGFRTKSPDFNNEIRNCDFYKMIMALPD